jgi:hypothetical protein
MSTPLIRTFRGTHQLDAFNGAPGITEVATFGNTYSNVSIRFYDNCDSNSCYFAGMCNECFTLVSPQYPTVFSIGSYTPTENFHVEGTAYISSNMVINGTVGIGTAAPSPTIANMYVHGTLQSDYLVSANINTSNGTVTTGNLYGNNIYSCNINTLYDGNINAGQGQISCGTLSNYAIQTTRITTQQLHSLQDITADNTITCGYNIQCGNVLTAGSVAAGSVNVTGAISANQFFTNNGFINAGSGTVTCGSISSSGLIHTSNIIAETSIEVQNGLLELGTLGTVNCGSVNCSSLNATFVSSSNISWDVLTATNIVGSNITLQSPPILTGFPYTLIMPCSGESQSVTYSASSPICTFFTTGLWTITKIRASVTNPVSLATSFDIRVNGVSIFPDPSHAPLTIPVTSAISNDYVNFNTHAQLIPDASQIRIFCVATDPYATGIKITFFYIM